MLDARGTALYVGKARSLKKRVPSYTRINQLPNRLKRMVSETSSLEIVTTHTEVEALLLEINMIKQLRPRYNVLLRDDKSFPHILIARDHDVSADRQTSRCAEAGRGLFRPICLCRSSKPHADSVAESLPAALVQ